MLAAQLQKGQLAPVASRPCPGKSRPLPFLHAYSSMKSTMLYEVKVLHSNFWSPPCEQFVTRKSPAIFLLENKASMRVQGIFGSHMMAGCRYLRQPATWGFLKAYSIAVEGTFLKQRMAGDNLVIFMALVRPFEYVIQSRSTATLLHSISKIHEQSLINLYQLIFLSFLIISKQVFSS